MRRILAMPPIGPLERCKAFTCKKEGYTYQKEQSGVRLFDLLPTIYLSLCPSCPCVPHAEIDPVAAMEAD